MLVFPVRYTNQVYVSRRHVVSFGLSLVLAVLAGQTGAWAQNGPVLVCFGDSITAGYGLQRGQSYPDFLKEKLDSHGYHYTINNQGTSGATTKDAVASLPTILRLHPEVVVVEFGGNDGLRGLPLEQTRHNLDQVLTTLEGAHIKILLAGITLPPNYGSDYVHSFDQVFRDVAAKHHAAFIPMIYKDLIHIPDTIQQDGIHPTAKGANILADTMLAGLKPLLHK